MTVSLKKGDHFLLNDEEGKALSHVTVGLGWDASLQKEGGFLKRLLTTAPQFDCDATVLMCKKGKIHGIDDVVYYQNLKHKSGAVEHTGDNRTGDGDGDDEQIIIYPNKIPAEYDRLVFIVNIFEPEARKQNFGMVTNAFIRFVNADTNNEICRFDLSSDYSTETAMIFGELVRNNGNWEFYARGEGTSDTCLEDVVKHFH